MNLCNIIVLSLSIFVARAEDSAPAKLDQHADAAWVQTGISIGESGGNSHRTAHLLRLQKELSLIRAERAESRRMGTFNATGIVVPPSATIVNGGTMSASQKATVMQNLLDDLRILKGTKREDLCAAGTYLDSIAMDAANKILPNCTACPWKCAECIDGTKRGCSKCISGYSMMMTKENPHVEFECLTTCPTGYTSLNGRCKRDKPKSTDGTTATASLIEAVNKIQSMFGSPPESQSESMASGPALLEEGLASPRRRRVTYVRRRCANRRRRRRKAGHHRRRIAAPHCANWDEWTNLTIFEGKCTSTLQPLQQELESWDEDCLAKLHGPADQICGVGTDPLRAKVQKMLEISNIAMTATSPTVQDALQIIGKIPIPYAKTASTILRNVARTVHDAADSAHTKAEAFNTKLDKLDGPTCGNITAAFEKIQTGVETVQKVLDFIDTTCACDCIQEQWVNELVARSQTARGFCQMPTWFQIPWMYSFDLPDILTAIFNFIADIIDEIMAALNFRMCFHIFWQEICFTIQDILDGLSWLLDFISGMIEGFITDIINAILSALGLPTLQQIFDMLVGLLPFNINWPDLPFPNWNLGIDINVPLPFKLDLGCANLSCAGYDVPSGTGGHDIRRRRQRRRRTRRRRERRRRRRERRRRRRERRRRERRRFLSFHDENDMNDYEGGDYDDEDERQMAADNGGR